MELIGLSFLVAVALGVVLFVIILLTRGVFARDLTHALKRVTQQEQGLQEKADVLEQRLRQMEHDYQSKLKRAELDAEQILQDAKTQAMNIRTAAIEEAKHRARQLLLEAESHKSQLKVEAARELNGKAVQQACASLRVLLSPGDLHGLHSRLVKELLESLRQMEVKPTLSASEPVVIETAQPLSEDDLKQVRQWGAMVAGTSVSVEVKTEPTLVAGCLVRVGETIIDNSLPNRLGQG
jgi:F0F1-type ATP synthase membrane subunit b/b'